MRPVDTALVVVAALLGLLTMPDVIAAESAAERVTAALLVLSCVIFVFVELRGARSGAVTANLVAEPDIVRPPEHPQNATVQPSQRRTRDSILMLVAFLVLVTAAVGDWILDLGVGMNAVLLVLIGAVIWERTQTRRG